MTLPQINNMSFENLLEITKKSFEKKHSTSEIQINMARDEKPPSGLIIDTPLFEFLLDRRFLALGRFYYAWGKKGSGKTSFFYELAKIFQANNGDVIWIETEHAADLDYAAKQGVDLTRMAIVHPSTLEEALDIAEEFIRNMPKAYPDGDTPVLICLDSIAGCALSYEIDERHTITDTMPGTHARLLARWYREMELPLANEKCIFLALNQQKDKIGGITYNLEDDAPESLIGGNAPLFSSTYQFKFYKLKDIVTEDEYGVERKVGTKLKIVCKRNKLGREGNKQFIEVNLYERGGIDFWTPLVKKLAAEYKILVTDAHAGWYKWNIPNTEYIDLKTNEKKIIPTEESFRDTELALMIKQSETAKNKIREVFGIPPLPAAKDIEELERERKQKRKRKKSLTDEE